ncbi:MAG: 2-oxoacid:acceptor oxidoreductase family protein [Candidatus Omnitrophota bacterium]
MKGQTEILISGFGGQGLLSLGKVLARAALSAGKHTTWFPSYGAEMRGGTAHCFVKISNSPIASPFIDYPDIAIIFNQPSLDKFKQKLKRARLVIVNSDLISGNPSLGNTKEVSLPFTKIALDCGNIKVANVVVLGVLTVLMPNLFNKKTLIEIIASIFKRKDILVQNLKALDKGQTLVPREKRGGKC